VIRPATIDDANELANIYNYYVQNTVVTFEEDNATQSEMESRIQKNIRDGLPWLVIEKNGKIAGYTYATKWNERAAYRHTVEVTIYLSNNAVSKGLGSRLYERLFSQLRGKSLHIAIGGITLPNTASVAIHEKFGMKKVAHFEAVGYKFGQWLDVGYWQMALNT